MDALVNHENQYGTIGRALQWAENRYLKDHGYQVDPLHQDPGASNWGELASHWKTVSMYACYGDPAHAPGFTLPGANNYDPWHNGPDDP